MDVPSFPHLFSPFKIRNLNLKNRILSTAHETHLGSNEGIGDALIAYHEARARGGAGMVITEVALVHPSAAFVANPIRVDTDDCISGYKKLAETMHSYDCGIMAQLFHPGREIIASEDGSVPVSYSASSTPNERFHVVPRAMTKWMIEEIIEHHGDAGLRLREAGVDGVEIVASHGYLPAQFLNPKVNVREDEYGGSLENRLRFIRNVANNIRSKVGEDFVVGLRLSASEMSPDGLDDDEMLTICTQLANDGVLDYLSIVAGSSSTLIGATHIVPAMSYDTGYTAVFASAIKAVSDIPVFVAGRINQPQTAEHIISSGQADICGMTRAMIADPEMPNKARTGRVDEIRACIACNQACVGHFLEGYPISCIQNPVSGRELQYGTLQPTSSAKSVLVVGGGPAGMKAAVTAAQRGHVVTLCERSAQLGGQILLAQLLPTRSEFGGAATNLANELRIAGATIRLNSEVNLNQIEKERPDCVVLATGATPFYPDFDGSETSHVVDAWQVLRNEVNVGASVLIADWRADWIGIGIAEKLALEGCHARLAVNGYMPGQTIQSYIRDASIGRLHSLGVEMIPYVRLFGMDGETVYLQHTMSEEAVILEEIDTVVLCQGHTPNNPLEDGLRELGIDVYLAGDCLAPRTVEEAVLEGFKVGIQI